MTGRPATCTSGLGTRLVRGRSRVPFPASGTMTFMSHPAVAVFEPDHVVDLGGRCLEQIRRHDRLELMDELRLDMEGGSPSHALFDQGIALLNAQDDLSGEYVDGLVLLVVVLERQHLPGLDMENLADVAVRAGPDQLVTPGLVNAIRKVRHVRLSLRDDGVVTQAVTHTPHPTQPSGLSTGRPPASITSARAPTGQARAQTPQVAPWNVMHRSGSSSRTPMGTSLHPPGGGTSAPVGHACAQGMSSHTTQAWMAGSIMGVPAARPAPGGALMMAFTGHTGMQSPHRVHEARKPNSSIAPGGRKFFRGATRRSVRVATSRASRVNASRKNPRRSFERVSIRSWGSG